MMHKFGWNGRINRYSKGSNGTADARRYRLTINRMDWIYYDQFIEITNALNEVIDLRTVTMQPLRRS